MDQLYVTREAIEAYERRTGFQGLGQFMIDKGLFVMTEENTCKTAWTPARLKSKSTTTTHWNEQGE